MAKPEVPPFYRVELTRMIGHGWELHSALSRDKNDLVKFVGEHDTKDCAIDLAVWDGKRHYGMDDKIKVLEFLSTPAEG